MPCTPPPTWNLLSDIDWTTPVNMTEGDSSPSDFAFGAPASTSPFDKTPAYYTPSPYPGQQTFNLPAYGYSSASSFSSTSGSATGSSFSDALPAISRDFVRPSPTETRRPATAGGALQSRSPFVGYMGGDRFQRQSRSSTLDGKMERTIEEGGVFVNPNPFAVTEEERQPENFVPRRASEPQYSEAPFFPLINPYLNQINYNPQFAQFRVPAARPQTSDGLPSYSGVVSLPSARTIVNQIDGFTTPQNFYPRPDEKTMQPSTMMPFRDCRAASMGTQRAYSIDSSKTARPSQLSQPPHSESESDFTFVPLGGPAPKKRPRRRFDEIERLYTCGWSGCEKSYGTLNHLNAHVAMQKHGEKRLPSEFKDMRKAWRKKKRDQTVAASASGQYPAWQRESGDSSSGSDFERRPSTASMSERGSVSYPNAYGYDSRPTTSSSIASSAHGRSYFPSQYSHHMLNAVPAAVRRPSAPGQIPMPQQFPQAFRPADGDHLTPTQQNPFPAIPRQAFPFQSLTSPMPVPMPAGGNQQFGAQFAFQR